MGTTTNERSKLRFFANLQTRKARRMYRKGLTNIETKRCETEQDDWCSDEDDYDSDDESEGIWRDQTNEKRSAW